MQQGNDDNSTGSEKKTFTTITFHFIKSNHFRVVHVDGAYGGPSPKGFIEMTVYSERNAIPQMVKEKFMQDGVRLIKTDGEERIGKEGYVREMETQLVMNLDTAKKIRDWLTSHCNSLEELQQKVKDDDAKKLA